MLRFFSMLAFSAVSVVLLTTCGIESIPFVAAPIAYSAGGSTVTTPLRFDHNSGNSTSDFRGYSIYYRCYDDPTKADSDRTAIENLAAATNVSPLTVFNTLRSTYQYRHMVYQGATSDPPDPVIPVSTPTDSISYFLTLQPLADWILVTATNGISDAGQIIDRDVSPQGSTAFPLTFNSDFEVGDLDYAGSTPFPQGIVRNALYVVIFVVGFGFDTTSTTFSLIPSLPASFGYSIIAR